MTNKTEISNEQKSQIEQFLSWFINHCTGYEKGEGQIFFDRLFQAFGHKGLMEAGAKCEKPMKTKMKKGTAFSDLVWGSRVIIELKKRGEDLSKHYDQAYDYWETITPHRPKFMVLCNFDEFWIYDLNIQLNDPVHKLKTKNIIQEWDAMSFLLESYVDPRFDNNNVEVTERVAKIVGSLYLSLEERGLDPLRAQRFVLQLVVALFSEDVDLIPKDTLLNILKNAVKEPVTQKELQGLFSAMAVKDKKDKPRKYQDIDYFNGGIFESVEPVELHFNELDLLYEAAKQNWAKVRPSIFGSIFEGSMDPDRRHGYGIHFTSEHDIHKIVGPTIVKPFKKKIEKAKSKKKLREVLSEICEFRVLDPACGSGNFLYIAFRELRRLEAEVLELLGEDPSQVRMSHISPENFFGIDTNKFALELAKVSLSIGRKLSEDELGIIDQVLPFQNLDDNFSDKDAILEAEWPLVNAIVGNPPYQSKNKMLSEFGQEYVNELRKKMPDVSGYADYCVYWFRKAHDHLQNGTRAGLVGTNTIRQNKSRESGLDYIVNNNGTITEAVSTQVWSGDAVVHVSIVNWNKGVEEKGLKKLFQQNGDSLDSPWEINEIPDIPSTLSPRFDVTKAIRLKSNYEKTCSFQGQTHGHEGFLLSVDEVSSLKNKKSKINKVLFPYLIGRELVGNKGGLPQRYVIDFGDDPIEKAMKQVDLFERVKSKVLPFREKKAKEEKERNDEIRKKDPKAKIDKQYANSLRKWWQLRRSKPEMIKELSKVKRYIACARVTKRKIFEFVSSDIHPNDKIQAFILEDDYSFGVINSEMHWIWFKEKCTTLKGDYNYNIKSVWDTFPWPQSPSLEQVNKVAKAAKSLRAYRHKIMEENNWSLRDLYRTLDLPGENALKEHHLQLDKAVNEAYGHDSKKTPLQFIFALNLELTAKQENGESVTPPGVPLCVKKPESLISEDCIKIEMD